MGSVPLQEWREGRLVWSTTGVRREKAAACSLGEGPHWSPAVGHPGGRCPAPEQGDTGICYVWCPAELPGPARPCTRTVRLSHCPLLTLRKGVITNIHRSKN